MVEQIVNEEDKRSFFVDVSKIEVGKRARKNFEDIDGLRTSIKRIGLIHPIVVRCSPDVEDGYVLLAGERRLRACLSLGHVTIKCTLLDKQHPMDIKAVELEENLRRQALSWQEECTLLEELDKLEKLYGGPQKSGGKKNWTQRDTATLVGQAPATVSGKIGISKLLRERPDIAERVKKLPMKVAMKTSRQILEDERLDRLQASGHLKRDSSILLGDVRELLKDLENDSVGLIVTDPPFGIPILTRDEKGGGRFDYEGKENTSLSYTSTLRQSDNATLEEVSKLFFDIVPELGRVLKPGGHVYIFFAMECYCILVRLLKDVFEINPVPLVWYKGRVTSPFYGFNYQPCYEPILFGYKEPRTRRLSRSAKTLLEYSVVPSKDKVHPFEKPRELLRSLITISSREGELILDPFAGSGATILAARECGRRGLGFEIDPSHFKSAQRLLSEEGR